MATNNLATTAAAAAVAAAPNEEEDKVRNMVMHFAFQKVCWQISTANTSLLWTTTLAIDCCEIYLLQPQALSPFVMKLQAKSAHYNAHFLLWY